MSAEVFVVISFRKEKRQGCFQNETTTKISGIKSLVIGLSNEKKIYMAKIRFFPVIKDVKKMQIVNNLPEERDRLRSLAWISFHIRLKVSP